MAKSGFLITQIKQRQDRIFSKLLEDMHLPMNGPQGRIIYVLWQENELTMSELSRKTSLANNTLSNMVERMVQQGMIERWQNPKNRRQVFVRLTESILAMKDKVETVSAEMNSLFYQGINEEEILQLDMLLERILHNLIEVEENNL